MRGRRGSALAFVGGVFRRGGRAVECGGLENRYGRVPSIEGSNPSPSVPAGCADTLADVPKTVREIKKILRAHGWTLERTVGSHRQYVHPESPNVVTVPSR